MFEKEIQNRRGPGFNFAAAVVVVPLSSSHPSSTNFLNKRQHTREKTNLEKHIERNVYGVCVFLYLGGTKRPAEEGFRVVFRHPGDTHTHTHDAP